MGLKLGSLWFWTQPRPMPTQRPFFVIYIYIYKSNINTWLGNSLGLITKEHSCPSLSLFHFYVVRALTLGCKTLNCYFKPSNHHTSITKIVISTKNLQPNYIKLLLLKNIGHSL